MPLFCVSFEIPVYFQFQFDSSVKLSISGLGPGCRHKVIVTSVVDTTSSGVVLEHVQNSVAVVFSTLHGGECLCVIVSLCHCVFVSLFEGKSGALSVFGDKCLHCKWGGNCGTCFMTLPCGSCV